MYFVWPRPWSRASGRVVRWPTAGVWRLGSGTRTSIGNGTSGAGAGARSRASASSSVPFFSTTAVLVSMDRPLYLRAVLRDCLDGFDHLAVTGAATQVAREDIADVRHRWIRVLIQQPLGRHDHAGAAEAALERPFLLERFLNGMEAIGVREAFDGQHVAPVHLPCEHQARVHEVAIDDDRAGAAIADVASELGARQIETLPEEPEERRLRRHGSRALFAVDRKGDRNHQCAFPVPACRFCCASSQALSSARFVRTAIRSRR